MRIFSGIRPTGDIHIGNYLGAIKQWIELQEKNECVFCVVDLHAITTPFKPEEMQKNILESAIIYLAAGINPEKSIIFVQSQVKEHAELAWLLNTITPMGELQRMTQFKEKTKKHPEYVNAGLFDYPVLMAADILLYKTQAVPVGKDQEQHVELARSIAKKFNQKFGEIFPEPKSILPKMGAKIMSLADPKKKMSKSDDPKSYISLFDLPEDIEKKIMLKVHGDFNSLFEKWFNILVDDDNLIVALDEDFSPLVEQNGYNLDYLNLSGGEKTAGALAYRLALNQVINNVVSDIQTKNLIILDEPTDGFSESQLDRMRILLQEIDIKQVIIVSHDPKIESYVDRVLRLDKKEGVTEVL